MIAVFMVPKDGLEPSRGCPHWILNPARLPISPLRPYKSVSSPSVYHQCTTGNTQGLLTIPKQLANVNKKVAPGISTFAPNFSLTVPWAG